MDDRENNKAESRGGLLRDEPLLIVSMGLDSETAEDLKQFIATTPLVRLHADVHDYPGEQAEPRPGWMRDSAPDICLIDFDRDRRGATVTAEMIHETLPGTVIFAVSSEPEPGLIIQAMRCGCSEYLLKPIRDDQVLEAIARVGARKRERREPSSGQALTFLGAKGGCGVTTVATHLAALLAKSSSRRALLIDLHPTFGDAALYLGLTKYQYSFHDLAESRDRLDSDLVQSFVLHHSSGLDVLPAPDLYEPSRGIPPEAISPAMDVLRLLYDFVLIDCPPGLSEQNLEAVRHSDQLYVITVPEIPALRNVARYLDYFSRAEFPSEKTQVVLNRHVKRSSIPDDEIEKAIRKSIYWKIPNQYNHVIQTINSGDPSSQVSASDVARNLMEWAEKIMRPPKAETSTVRANKGLLALLRQ
ncbi:MAG: AAA family ATPase [Terriglobia bacterium]